MGKKTTKTNKPLAQGGSFTSKTGSPFCLTPKLMF